jgi:hypothetical protein
MRTLLAAIALGTLAAHTAHADPHVRPTDWNVDWRSPIQTTPALAWDQGTYSPLPSGGRTSYSSGSWTGTVDLVRFESAGEVDDVDDAGTHSTRVDGRYHATLAGAKLEYHKVRGDDDFGAQTTESISSFAGVDATADDLTNGQVLHLPGGSAGGFSGVKGELNAKSLVHFCGMLATIATNAQAGVGFGAYVSVPLTIDWIKERVIAASPSPTVIPGVGGGWSATVEVSFDRLLSDPRYAARCAGRQIAKLSAVQVDLVAVVAQKTRNALVAARRACEMAKRLSFYRAHPEAIRGGSNVERFDDTLGAEKTAARGPSIAVGQTR